MRWVSITRCTTIPTFFGCWLKCFLLWIRFVKPPSFHELSSVPTYSKSRTKMMNERIQDLICTLYDWRNSSKILTNFVKNSNIWTWVHLGHLVWRQKDSWAYHLGKKMNILFCRDCEVYIIWCWHQCCPWNNMEPSSCISEAWKPMRARKLCKKHSHVIPRMISWRFILPNR